MEWRMKKVWWRWKGKEAGGEGEGKRRGEGCYLLVGFNWGCADELSVMLDEARLHHVRVPYPESKEALLWGYF